jgi:hypothetical protein
MTFLGKEDLIAIGKGLLIAVGGAALVYLGQALVNYNFGEWTPLVVAVAGAIVNIGRKLLDGKVQ